MLEDHQTNVLLVRNTIDDRCFHYITIIVNHSSLIPETISLRYTLRDTNAYFVILYGYKKFTITV